MKDKSLNAWAERFLVLIVVGAFLILMGVGYAIWHFLGWHTLWATPTLYGLYMLYNKIRGSK